MMEELFLFFFIIPALIYALFKYNKWLSSVNKNPTLESGDVAVDHRPSDDYRPSDFTSLQERANSGDPEAQVDLGNVYKTGKLNNNIYEEDIVAINYDLAEFWYRRAITKKHHKAFNSLADMFSALGDEKKWAGVMLESAKWGNPNHMCAVGICYLKGIRTFPVDINAGIYWLRKSARSDYFYAQKVLADEYAKGVSLKRDLVKSYMWYTISAQKEERSNWERYAWFYRSCADDVNKTDFIGGPPGRSSAEIARDKIVADMNHDEILIATRFAEICVKNNYDNFD